MVHIWYTYIYLCTLTFIVKINYMQVKIYHTWIRWGIVCHVGPWPLGMFSSVQTVWQTKLILFCEAPPKKLTPENEQLHTKNPHKLKPEILLPCNASFSRSILVFWECNASLWKGGLALIVSNFCSKSLEETVEVCVAVFIMTGPLT